MTIALSDEVFIKIQLLLSNNRHVIQNVRPNQRENLFKLYLLIYYGGNISHWTILIWVY